jgi:hypothetical protein
MGESVIIQSNCWVNLRILGQSCEFHLRVASIYAAPVSETVTCTRPNPASRSRALRARGSQRVGIAVGESVITCPSFATERAQRYIRL